MKIFKASEMMEIDTKLEKMLKILLYSDLTENDRRRLIEVVSELRGKYFMNI